ncbi:hypothetical protein BC835DRAFT_1303682 [Cytidiella melzeri]|nr:hypothetical protein BC835DRAFT_1303682 [Cytidiella melzeri]
MLEDRVGLTWAKKACAQSVCGVALDYQGQDTTVCGDISNIFARYMALDSHLTNMLMHLHVFGALGTNIYTSPNADYPPEPPLVTDLISSIFDGLQTRFVYDSYFYFAFVPLQPQYDGPVLSCISPFAVEVEQVAGTYLEIATTPNSSSFGYAAAWPTAARAILATRLAQAAFTLRFAFLSYLLLKEEVAGTQVASYQGNLTRSSCLEKKTYRGNGHLQRVKKANAKGLQGFLDNSPNRYQAETAHQFTSGLASKTPKSAGSVNNGYAAQDTAETGLNDTEASLMQNNPYISSPLPSPSRTPVLLSSFQVEPLQLDVTVQLAQSTTHLPTMSTPIRNLEELEFLRLQSHSNTYPNVPFTTPDNTHTSKGSLPSMSQEKSTALLLDDNNSGDVLHNKALSAVITSSITEVLSLQYGFTCPDGERTSRKTEAQSWLPKEIVPSSIGKRGHGRDLTALITVRELPPAEICDMNPEAEERGLEADTGRSFIAASKFDDGERLGVKPHNTDLTIEDYKAYIQVRDNLLEGVAGQTALTQGGIAWRLAWGVCSINNVLEGPPVNHCLGYVHLKRIVANQDSYAETTLTLQEQYVISGVYHVQTPQAADHGSIVSWWPIHNTWLDSGLNVGFWSQEAED